MKTAIRWLAMLLVAGASLPAGAALKVLATTPDWGALTTELGGDKVNVYVATTALQDVHRVEAKPSLVARARSADLVVATGAELEIGWLPVLIQESGNAHIQPGAPGWMRELPDSWMSTGSQPISSSAPVATSRSAVRARATRLGFASTRCTSCSAVVATYTFTLSPPSSVVSAPQSGVVASTLSAALAGRLAAPANINARTRMSFMRVT